MTADWLDRTTCPAAVSASLDSMFGASTWRVQVISGGMTNQNWRVRFDDGRGDAVLQVQLAADEAERLGIRREVQLEMERLITELDLAPRVIGRSTEPHAVATEFVHAEALPSVGEARQRGIRDVAEALRRLHAIDPPVDLDLRGRLADGFTCIRWLLGDVSALAPALLDANRDVVDLIDEFEQLRGPYDQRLVHSDLSAGNVLVGERTYLIDWEYSGLGDVYYDLGGFSARNDLDDAEERALISAYLGEPDERALAITRMYRFLTIFAEALWGVTAADIGFADFDHGQYSEKFFADTRDAAASSWLRDAIDFLRTTSTPESTSSMNTAPTDKIRYARIDEVSDRWVPYTRGGVTRGEELVINRATHAGAGLRSMIWRTGPTEVDYHFKVDEVIVVLSGSATVEMVDGPTFVLRAGDVWSFEGGQRAHWTVEQEFSKVGVLSVDNPTAEIQA